jgi:hypothetical protein
MMARRLFAVATRQRFAAILAEALTRDHQHLRLYLNISRQSRLEPCGELTPRDMLRENHVA